MVNDCLPERSWQPGRPLPVRRLPRPWPQTGAGPEPDRPAPGRSHANDQGWGTRLPNAPRLSLATPGLAVIRRPARAASSINWARLGGRQIHNLSHRLVAPRASALVGEMPAAALAMRRAEGVIKSAPGPARNSGRHSISSTPAKRPVGGKAGIWRQGGDAGQNRLHVLNRRGSKAGIISPFPRIWRQRFSAMAGANRMPLRYWPAASHSRLHICGPRSGKPSGERGRRSWPALLGQRPALRDGIGHFSAAPRKPSCAASVSWVSETTHSALSARVRSLASPRHHIDATIAPDHRRRRRFTRRRRQRRSFRLSPA